MERILLPTSSGLVAARIGAVATNLGISCGRNCVVLRHMWHCSYFSYFPYFRSSFHPITRHSFIKIINNFCLVCTRDRHLPKHNPGKKLWSNMGLGLFRFFEWTSAYQLGFCQTSARANCKQLSTNGMENANYKTKR